MNSEYGNLFGALLTDFRGIVREEVKKISIPSQSVSMSKFKPIGKFCDEMDMSRATLYNHHRKGTITLKKMGDKTFVDNVEFEAAMRDFKSEVEKIN